MGTKETKVKLKIEIFVKGFVVSSAEQVSIFKFLEVKSDILEINHKYNVFGLLQYVYCL